MPTKPVMNQPGTVEVPSESIDRKLSKSHPENVRIYHDLHPQIVSLLEQLRDDQRDFISLLRERSDVTYDISRTAQELWVSNVDAWAGRDREELLFWTGIAPGQKFLEDIIPVPMNLQQAKFVFEKWVNRPKAYFTPSKEDILVDSELTEDQIKIGEYNWPKQWRIPEQSVTSLADSEPPYCRCNVVFTSPNNFKDPFTITPIKHGQIVQLPERSRCSENISGIIAQFTIDQFVGIIDLDTVATILSLVKANDIWPPGGPEFLARHIAEWRNRSMDSWYGLRSLELPPDHGAGAAQYKAECGVLMCHMRSFVAADRGENKGHTKPSPGLKCVREHIPIRAFYKDTMIELTERRYSTALTLLPLQKPAGNYALVSICDGQQIYNHGMSENGVTGGHLHVQYLSTLCKRYGVYPAGLYTGVSVFQLQICVFIDSWEQDWISTITYIDKMVSLKLNVFQNDKLLEELLLGNSTDDSILYFKLLQLLSRFSDMVGAAPSYLDALQPKLRNQLIGHFDAGHWFIESYPYTEHTRNIINHNWEIVRQRQRSASERILEKLKRTSNEVKGLQSGLFNVQSITEVRKTRILNKYLMVFTIVTILFLPPTFVATFFGMHIFDSSTVDATQEVFWRVLGTLSGATYLVACLGLFSSNISAKTRRELGARFSAVFFRNCPSVN